jgi:hypothetical protein
MTQYATLVNFKAYLAIDASDEDTVLNLALTHATALIDTHTHRTFVAGADSTRRFDALLDVDGLRLWLDLDLCQLTSVVNGDGVTVPPTAMLPEPAVGPPYYALTLKRSSGLSWTYDEDAEQAIVVTGRWAYSIAPPDTIVQATLRLAAWLYHQRDNALDLDRTVIVGNSVITPAAIPADVITYLRPYMRIVV